MTRKRSYDAAFKLKVVQYAEKNSNRAAARRHQVDERSVRDWRKQKEQLNTLPSKKQCLQGGGRKPKLPEVEEQLTEWIEHQRAQHLWVTRTMIQQKAMQFHFGDEEFSASRGWLENFLRRHNFSLRRKTTVSQRLPEHMIAKVSTFELRIRRMRLLHQYPLPCIGNNAETPLWLDMPGDTTVTRAGERTVSIHTTGHDKGRFTVTLAAMADGRKLKRFVVFKGVRITPELNRVPGVVVALSKWLDEPAFDSQVGRLGVGTAELSAPSISVRCPGTTQQKK